MAALGGGTSCAPSMPFMGLRDQAETKMSQIATTDEPVVRISRVFKSNVSLGIIYLGLPIMLVWWLVLAYAAYRLVSWLF